MVLMNTGGKKGKDDKQGPHRDKARRQIVMETDKRGKRKVYKNEKKINLHKMSHCSCRNEGKNVKEIEKQLDVDCNVSSSDVDSVITLNESSMQRLSSCGKRSCSGSYSESCTSEADQNMSKEQLSYYNYYSQHCHCYSGADKGKGEGGDEATSTLSKLIQLRTDCPNGSYSVDGSEILNSSSCCASCTTSDFRAVEQELKELLSGYHKIVDDACGKTQSLEKPLKTSTVVALTLLAEPESANNSEQCIDAVLPFPCSHGSFAVGGGAEAACNGQVLQSVVSLPVSSVPNDRSTDANTPMPCIGTQQCASTLKNDFDNSGLTNDDLFADALTEDQLNRSFEMQWQQKQLAQKVCGDFCNGGLLSSKAMHSNSNVTLLWDSFSKVECDTNSFAIKQELGSSLFLPSVAQNMRQSHGNLKEKVLMYDMSYDSRIYTPYRYQDTISSNGKPLPGGLAENKETTRTAADKLCPVLHFVNCDVHNTQVGAIAFQAKKERAPRDELPMAPVNLKAAVKTQKRRKSSHYRGEVVGSTVPEIATSARRTENPSMRSGVTDGRGVYLSSRRKGLDGTGCYHVDRAMRASVVENSGNGDYCCAEEKDKHGTLHHKSTGPSLTASGGMAANRVVAECHHGRILRHQLRHLSIASGNTFRRCAFNAVTRFHEMVERRAAALESTDTRHMAQLPAFADSLVGAAISNLYPVVKRRQAQLKESQHAEAAAAAAAVASLTRSIFR